MSTAAMSETNAPPPLLASLMQALQAAQAQDLAATAAALREAVDHAAEHMASAPPNADALAHMLRAVELTESGAAELAKAADFDSMVYAEAAQHDAAQARQALEAAATDAEALHVAMLALRDETAQAVALLDTYNAANSLEHTHNPATPLEPANPADARIIQALRDGHGTRWGLRLVELPDVLAVEPDEATPAGQALFNHARSIGQIARGEIDGGADEPLH